MNNEQNIQVKPIIEQQNQGVNIKEQLLKYLHYYWLFIITILIGLTCAWLYLRYSTPVYSVKSTMLIRSDNSGRGGGGEDFFSDIALFQSSVNKQNEIEILKSRAMMERVVNRLGLQKDYYVKGNLKNSSVYKDAPFSLEFVNLSDSNANFTLNITLTGDNAFRLNEGSETYYFGQPIELPSAIVKLVKQPSSYDNLNFKEFFVVYRNTSDAAEMYMKNLSVAPTNDQANLLGLTFTTINPRQGADILNTLMQEYSDATIEDKNEINKRIIAFIDDRLGVVEQQLDSVEYNFQNFRTRREYIDIETQTQTQFSNMSELERRIREQEIQMQITELLENYLRNPQNKLNLVPSTLGLTDPTLIQLMEGYNSLVAERERQLQTGATPTNPVVLNIEKQIEDSRLRMLDNLVNIRTVYKSAIDAFNIQQQAIRGQISSVPRKQREANEIMRQQEIKQSLYLYLLQKKEEAAIAEASTISNSRIIDKARPIPALVKPIPLRIYGIGFVAGLLLPIIIIFVLDLFNDKVITRNDITRATDTPILGEIGHSEETQVMLFPERSRSVIAEQIRILRSNLGFVLGNLEERKPVIMVTSSFSGEGKSYISTNLAAAYAVTGKKVVILEFDLRKPKVIDSLGLDKSQGITNYLVGGATLEDLPQLVPGFESLYVIPCGPVPPNPAELLLNKKIDKLFQWLKENFEVVLVDTAPVGLVSDALSLGRFAYTTLYIVRQRYTYKAQLNFIDDLYKQKKLPSMGIVVNDAKAQGAQGYYGYGGGRYGYGYGYGISKVEGYYETNQTRTGWKKFFKR